MSTWLIIFAIVAGVFVASALSPILGALALMGLLAAWVGGRHP
jgi:hypothetical protein